MKIRDVFKVKDDIMTVGDLSNGRQNNLDIIRFFAATMVLFSHCYPLSSGVQLEDPLAVHTHFINFGALGVYIFFLISGFLVTKSYDSRNNLLVFVKARCLRIFPGLIVALLFSVYVIGLMSTSLPAIDYILNKDNIRYILHNTFLYKIWYGLPGVFSGNPYPAVVNGSLWTLPVEFKMYIMVALVGVFGILKNRKLFNGFVISALVLVVGLWINGIQVTDKGTVLMVLYFIAGSVAYIQRDKIPMHPMILVGLWMVFIIVLKTGSTVGANWIITLMQGAFIPALSYTVLFLAYHPAIKFNKFGKYGDFSYGMYIYAFPVQQFVVSKMKPIGPYSLFIAAFVITLVLSILSWKLVEKPALGLKGKRRIFRNQCKESEVA